MPDYRVSGRIKGYLGKLGGIGGEKQPKTCVWVSVVGGKAFLQRSHSTIPSQRERILAVLQSGRSLTAYEMHQMGIMGCNARILELRRAGVSNRLHHGAGKEPIRPNRAARALFAGVGGQGMSILKLDYQGLPVHADREAWFNATEIAAMFGRRPIDWLRLPEGDVFEPVESG